MLNWLFAEECRSNSIQGDPSNRTASADEIFSVSCEAMPGGKVLLPGRVALFLSFLMYSPDLEDVKLAITRKLGWFLDTLTDEDLYSSILVSQIPVIYSSGKTLELVCEPLFSALLHGLKTFMIVVSSCQAWDRGIYVFSARQFFPSSLSLLGDLRKMARSICILLTHGRHSVVDQVYNIVVGDDNSQSSSIMYVALLLEGSAVSDVQFYQCKAELALFLTGIANIKMSESDDCAKSVAVWELYHMALRAGTGLLFIWHLQHLDTSLLVFLDKELALVTVAHSSEQLELLVKEGRMLREITQKVSDIKLEPTGCENIETDGGIQRNKRRKLPDGISKGVELLQDGLKVIGDGISQWQQNQSDSIELQDKFLTQLSCLEDVISQIVGMTNSG
ncbi:hypothetical protein Q3G72_011910 [Acer saccharum]|nr:hypothetical protein Q3G72_011910 [Acer saccharum]